MQFRRFAPLALLFAFAGCTQTASAPPAPATPVSGITPSGFRLPEGSGCSGEISRYRAVVDNDLATGHVGRSVHARISGEVDQAASACAGGRDAEAIRMVNATKARFGYR